MCSVISSVWPNKKPFRRAAKWDGVCPMGRDHEMTPDDFREMLDFINQSRQTDSPFAVLAAGHPLGKDEDQTVVAPFAEAGVTWWQEGFS